MKKKEDIETMKKYFENPELELLKFVVEDIVTASKVGANDVVPTPEDEF